MPQSNQREFFRVDGQIYIYVEPIAAGESLDQEAQGVFVPTFGSEQDDIVGLSIDAFREQIRLSEIDAAQKEYWFKVQQILALMKRSFEAELDGREPKRFLKCRVNISGSGVAFPSAASYLVGQNVRLAMFFPRYPYSYLTIVGEVVKCERKDLGYWVRCRFREISEKSQDEVLRFVNQCQRDNRSSK